MAIKNGRYKDKNGNVRHFETNENMIIVDDGQKTLKQKLSSLFESLSDLIKRFTTHETSEIAHKDIREQINNIDTSWSGITEKPEVFPPSEHTHDDLTNLIDRGYLNSKIVTSFDSTLGNGKYTLTNPTDAPDKSTSSVWTLDVTMRDGSAVHQQATCLYSNLGNNYKVYVRYRASSVWTAWEEMATMSSVLPLKGGIVTGDLGVSGTCNLQTVGIDKNLYVKVNSVATDVGLLLNELKTNCVNTKSAVLNADLAVDNGVYHYWNNEGMVNFPSDVGNDKIGTLTVLRGSTFPMQLWSNYYGGLWYRSRGAGASEWSKWEKIATTKKTALTLLNGWTDFFGTEPATISKVGNVVTIKACIKSGTYTNGTTIFTVPTDYKPSQTQTILVDVEDGSWVTSRKFISIYSDGRCVCNGVHSNTRVTIYVSYIV